MSRGGTEHDDLRPTPLRQEGIQMCTGVCVYRCRVYRHVSVSVRLRLVAARAISMADTDVLPHGAVHTCTWRFVSVDAVRAISYSDGWQKMGHKACSCGPCMYDNTTAGFRCSVAGL
jgi:hypothetical protein